MKIIEGKNIDPEQWGGLVKRSSVATLFQTSVAYGFFWQSFFFGGIRVCG